MPFHDFDYEELTKVLTDNFNILADEVQLLSDRKTILEHKLRFAHEQYQYLADKFAPSDPEIANTLAKLQLPPDLQISVPEIRVPLPGRGRTATSSKLQTAVVIRDGRKAAQKLAGIRSSTAGSTISGERSISGVSSNMRVSARRTSLSTVLEQDFTVQGKQGSLLCPFTKSMKPPMDREYSHGASTLESDRPLTPSDAKDPTPHGSADPICAAMYAETMNSPAPSQAGSAAKCPIRYLDQHSPEDIARYFETHKHEIPRSHEVCVKRYQRNDDDIAKLDAKYGNLVSMIQGLGQKHKPMLPSDQEEGDIDEELERTSNERVENWAKAVSADGVGQEEPEEEPSEDDDREGRFDRPLKEIRVGESPSRPWGITVPIFDPPLDEERAVSPPPAPVSSEHMPKPAGKCPFGHDQKPDVEVVEHGRIPAAEEDARPTGKCPFSHGQAQAEQKPAMTRTTAEQTERPAGKCPFGHDQPAPITTPIIPRSTAEQNERPAGKCPFGHDAKSKDEEPASKIEAPKAEPARVVHTQPTFINPPEAAQMGGHMQMVFNGPVFIGYPMEQAIAFMNQFKEMQ